MTPTQTYLAQIRARIAKDDCKTAIQQLSALLKDSPHLDKAVQQSARYNHVMQQIRLGLVDFESANIAQNQIRAGILDLLREVEEQGTNPAINAEFEQSVRRLTQSKNNMKNQKKAASLSAIIAILGVLLGFLGELMPDSFKSSVQNFATQTLGISYMKFWVGSVFVVAVLMLIFIWKEALGKNDDSDKSQDTGNNNRTVHQHGDKSVYIEKNDGPINIK